MSKVTWIIVSFLLALCLLTARWHHRIDVEMYESRLTDDLFIMQVLAEKIDERDQFIYYLIEELNNG